MKLLTALLLISLGRAVAEPETRPEPAARASPDITEPITVPPIEPAETTTESLDSGPRTGPRISEFQRDEIGLVLRTLARQAGVSVYVDDSVTGTVTMRIKNKTPLETLEAVCAARGLVMQKQNGTFIICCRNPPPPGVRIDKAAMILGCFLALSGWFGAGIFFQRWRSAAAEK